MRAVTRLSCAVVQAFAIINLSEEMVVANVDLYGINMKITWLVWSELLPSNQYGIDLVLYELETTA